MVGFRKLKAIQGTLFFFFDKMPGTFWITTSHLFEVEDLEQIPIVFKFFCTER